VFDLRKLCFLFKQSTLIIMFIILFMMCLVFMSLTDYVQLILYADILTVILKLLLGMLSVFI